MTRFDGNSKDLIVIMYPTGGYGHFLYYLLSEHIDCTVKPTTRSWQFDRGNSHSYSKYTQVFDLGSAVAQGKTKKFKYDYQLLDTQAEQQIAQGQRPVVLADMGNKGDNIKFLRRYFPQAQIVRIYAQSFCEKLVVWTNCMLKSRVELRDSLYPGSILTTQGIAQWTNKIPQHVTDQDAVDCMVNFFRNDFDIYGKMFAQPDPGAWNVPVSAFFTQQSINQAITDLAQLLNSTVITNNLDTMSCTFLQQQEALSLLEPGSTFDLVRKAMQIHGHQH